MPNRTSTHENDVFIDIGAIRQVVAINIRYSVHLVNRSLDGCITIFRTSVGYKVVVIVIKVFGAAQISTAKWNSVMKKTNKIILRRGHFRRSTPFVCCSYLVISDKRPLLSAVGVAKAPRADIDILSVFDA